MLHPGLFSVAPSGSSQSFGGGELFGRGVLSPGVAEAVLIFHRPSEVGSPGRALFPGFLWVAVRGLNRLRKKAWRWEEFTRCIAQGLKAPFILLRLRHD